MVRKWAQLVLDQARLLTPMGYEKDMEGPMWQYRDWVKIGL